MRQSGICVLDLFVTVQQQPFFAVRPESVDGFVYALTSSARTDYVSF